MDKYSSYKDSGVKWLGEVPSHWELRHLRNFLTVFSEKGYGDSQLLSVTRERGVILRDKENKEENHNFVPDDLSGYKHLNAGDFVINKMKSWQGSYGVSEYDGIVSPAYFTCKLKGVSPQFFSRAIRSKAYIGFFMQYSKGIRVDQWDLDPNSMKDIPFVLPPLSEQNAIASYLDSVTTQIDTAIAQQKKMIELLNERKQIIINNAVTKGLDPNVKMKDSGVDWIGEIPEHWDFCKFNHIISVLTDYTANGSFGDLAKNVHYQSEGYARLVRLTDLRDNLQNENGVWVDKHGYEYLSKSSLYGGELLIANVGAYSGLVQIMPKVDYLTTLAPNMFLLKLDNTKVLTDYIYFLLLSKAYFNWLQTIAIASAQPKLNKDNIRTLPILIPTIDEQKAIVDRIANAIKPLENLISITQKQITLLQERKQIIINEVVTGKVKVS
jgi:type I restriction enzyme S subunit